MLQNLKYYYDLKEIIEKKWTCEKNIGSIKDWLVANDGDMPAMPDEQIALFLIACNNDVENTKKTIENHLRIKCIAPNLFCNRDIHCKDMQQAMATAHVAPATARTKDDNMIVFGSLKNTSYQAFILDNLIRQLSAVIDISLNLNPPKGLIFIVNLKGFGLMHLTRFKIGSIKWFLAYVQEALPTQLKAVHVLNANYIFEKILTILKPFMKKELFDMIMPHPVGMNMTEFFEKYIPADCMPSDFEGNLPSLDELCEDFQKQWKKMGAFLEAEEKQALSYKK